MTPARLGLYFYRAARECRRIKLLLSAAPKGGPQMTKSQIVSVCAILITFPSLIVSTASATNPRLTRISPYGGQLGTEVDVFFTGSNLGDAVEFMPYDDGIEVVSYEVIADKNGRSTKAKLRKSPRLPNGRPSLPCPHKNGRLGTFEHSTSVRCPLLTKKSRTVNLPLLKRSNEPHGSWSH